MIAGADDCIHLTVEIVREIHREVIDEFGGLHGVRDEALGRQQTGVAMACAIVFLRLNGVDTAPDSPEWERLMLDVASSRLDREEATARFRRLARRAGPPKKARE